MSQIFAEWWGKIKSFNNNHYAVVLWVLSCVFMLRVFGQMVQRWLPQLFLPAFDTFQGSHLSYGLLLPSQLVILFTMICLAWRVQHGVLIPSRRLGRTLLWIANIYMIAALSRIIIGLVVPGAPAWFSAWIPAVFHVVLAVFILILALFHQYAPRKVEEESQ